MPLTPSWSLAQLSIISRERPIIQHAHQPKPGISICHCCNALTQGCCYCPLIQVMLRHCVNSNLPLNHTPLARTALMLHMLPRMKQFHVPFPQRKILSLLETAQTWQQMLALDIVSHLDMERCLQSCIIQKIPAIPRWTMVCPTHSCDAVAVVAAVLQVSTMSCNSGHT